MAFKNTLLSILALAIAYYFTTSEWVLISVVAVTLLSLTFPQFLAIQDVIWRIINQITEFIGNKIILSVIFFLIITPLSIFVKFKPVSRGFVEVNKTQNMEETVYMG